MVLVGSRAHPFPGICRLKLMRREDAEHVDLLTIPNESQKLTCFGDGMFMEEKVTCAELPNGNVLVIKEEWLCCSSK